jgi:hypothetical protein
MTTRRSSAVLLTTFFPLAVVMLLQSFIEADLPTSCIFWKL